MIEAFYPSFSDTEKELLDKINQVEKFKGDGELILKLEAFSSTTVRSSNSFFKRWIEASLYIEDLSENEILTVDSLVKLNFLLTGNHGLRKKNIYAGYSSFPEANRLEGLLNAFVKKASCIDNTISKAAFIYQYLVSIHPFSDGNGRLSRLIASKVLTTENYMPLAFSDQGAGFVIPKTKEENYHYIVLKKILVSYNWLSNISNEIC